MRDHESTEPAPQLSAQEHAQIASLKAFDEELRRKFITFVRNYRPIPGMSFHEQAEQFGQEALMDGPFARAYLRGLLTLKRMPLLIAGAEKHLYLRSEDLLTIGRLGFMLEATELCELDTLLSLAMESKTYRGLEFVYLVHCATMAILHTKRSA